MKHESHKLRMNLQEQISLQRIKADQRQWLIGGHDYKSLREHREAAGVAVPGGQLTDGEE